MLDKIKKRDFYAKDLLTPKYRMRVVKSKKSYNRQAEKMEARNANRNSYF